MKQKQLSKKETVTIGLMLFALFFGAGNMIFPPLLGQTAGTSVWIAILGFILTGVGLPILAVAATATTSGDLKVIAGRVHPLFGIIFPTLIYLAIGPFFGIPRTASVAYEIGLSPLLSDSLKGSNLPLLVYSIVYMSITFWLCLNPTKLVDRIGKVLTPTLLLIIAILFVRSIFKPLGDFTVPSEAYMNNAFFKGFLEGYLTMDTLGALVFGIVVISSIQNRGITDQKSITMATVKAGSIAGVALALVYMSLAYLGAGSSTIVGTSTNGGQILTAVVSYLFGQGGVILLGTAITLACLTTSIGLITACGQFFSNLIPALSYKVSISILTVFSLIVANLGLNQIISFSVPVLAGLYPIAIVLILLSLIHKQIKGYKEVYIYSVVFAGIISLVDCLHAFGFAMGKITVWLQILPLYSVGIGWVVPAIIGAVIGFIVGSLKSQDRVNPSTQTD
ncbi:branched-chain amino acid transport system II carrier protein [Brevibacillus laterosporus]|uniref:branched-chain amino acid transport system II carrier protein n=1 Tax=Brevibacillus laterosporus TaxID=1465 RepID=UPI00264E59B5|nr:branched-chain amino acid transport system II carrier protein [Brevibacillus laterosporus]MDN9009697.1 branched-chain amino acid transport system II carrier protein [Brevibacillus laterosporus]MDO0940304.1 branched-chain amino acid transport system II carrier protein [Brevibacillus laterosporus]